MILAMNLIAYSKGEPIIRKYWDLGKITVEEFDPQTHAGKVFLYPEGKDGAPTEDSVYIWKSALPENNEESDELVRLGKMGRC